MLLYEVKAVIKGNGHTYRESFMAKVQAGKDIRSAAIRYLESKVMCKGEHVHVLHLDLVGGV